MASTGTILVNVYTSGAKIPVEGATVLFQQQEPPNSLLGLRITDKSGQTAPLTIETVDQSESQAPETRVIPWTGLNIHVDHPEFERVILQGVQIFPGITTVQNVQLLPLQEHDPNIDSQQDLIFTPQPVWEDAT